MDYRVRNRRSRRDQLHSRAAAFLACDGAGVTRDNNAACQVGRTAAVPLWGEMGGMGVVLFCLICGRRPD